MLDEPMHGPVHALSRRGPLAGLDRIDQLADCRERTSESVELNFVVYGHEATFHRWRHQASCLDQQTPRGAETVIDTERRTSFPLQRSTMSMAHQPCGRAEIY
jgi:hypothetical protein